MDGFSHLGARTENQRRSEGYGRTRFRPLRAPAATPGARMSRNLPVNPGRISADIEALSAITEPDHPWTRRAFSPLFLEGRAYLEARMRAIGLETRIDASGN